MKKNNDNDIKQYELIPVGKTEIEQDRVYVHIFPDFRPALKYLELFSHATLLQPPQM